LTKKAEFSEQLERRGAKVYCLDLVKQNDITELTDIYKAYKPLRKIIEGERFDIVHTHLFHSTVLGIFTANRLKLKSVVTRHHSDALYKIQNPATRKLYLSLENYINRNANHIIAPSREVQKILLERENVPSEKVSLIPYGQTFERFEAITPEIISEKRSELKMNGKLSLVCTSRLFHGKGHVYLFEALAKLIKDGLQANLFLVGTGDYRPKLEEKLRELEIEDSVRFLGWRNDALAIMAAADIIVHPSLEDALSQALIESLMLARPIVATDISGASDTLRDGKYGRLVPPADAESFRKALQETIDNLESVQTKAHEGRKYLLEYMKAERTAKEYSEIYHRV